jgi:hypothetical protein
MNLATLMLDKEINFLEKCLQNPDNITFLFGSGISRPYPTSIPTVNDFYDSLIKKSSIEPEIQIELWNMINNTYPQPRFEVFINEFQKYIDKESKFINIFNIQSFNTIHSFIANYIENGSIGITTNFDLCIEYAGINSEKVFSYNGLDIKEIKKGNNLYKPHGSIDLKKNIVITDESLSKTNDGFISLPNWRKTLIDSLDNKIVIVLGYSGSDDFDITPILLESKPKLLVWIEYENIELDFKKFEDVNVKLKKILEGKQFYILKGDFQKYIESKFTGISNSSYINSIDINKIIDQILGDENSKKNTEKLLLKHFGCYHTLLEKSKDKKFMLDDLYFIYSLYKLSLYGECINYIQQLDLNKSINSDLFYTYVLYLNSSLFMKGDFWSPLNNFNKIKDKFNFIQDFRLKCDIFNLYGSILYINGIYKESFNAYKKSYKFSKEFFYLEGLLKSYWGIADILDIKKKHKISISFYNRAFIIAESLGKNTSCVTLSRNIAESYINIGIYNKAKEYVILSDRLIKNVEQKYNEVYLLFTKLKLTIIDSEASDFYRISNSLLILIKSGIATAIVIDLLILLIVANIDRNFSLKEMKYYDFQNYIIEKIGLDQIKKKLNNSDFIEIILDPLKTKNYTNDIIMDFRLIVFHSNAYINQV